jgi:microcystin-dependent protein
MKRERTMTRKHLIAITFFIYCISSFFVSGAANAQDPFIGEIRMFGFTFCPRGWATCDGQLLSIAQNNALFALLGTIYGGDGRTTFGLPDLRGRVPIHVGQGPGLTNRRLGEKGGAEAVTLSIEEMPEHRHQAMASTAKGTSQSPRGRVCAKEKGTKIYKSGPPNRQMDPSTIETEGAGMAHENMPPFNTLTFCIAIQGIFPPRN